MNSTRLPGKSFYLYKNRVQPLQQRIKKLFVLDFEATCEKDVQISPQVRHLFNAFIEWFLSINHLSLRTVYRNKMLYEDCGEIIISFILTKLELEEIIEFPCLVVDSTSYNIEAKFHQYVKPKFHPVSSFCTELTGISPATVENESEFPVVFEQFNKWLETQQQTVSHEEMIFVTCGNWDLKIMLPKQCALCNLTIPEVMRRWINLKVAFYQGTGHFPRGLVDMHKRLDLKLSGRLHSGIDDCLSMVQILQHLLKNGLILTETNRL